jgi:hypothetical protein
LHIDLKGLWVPAVKTEGGQAHEKQSSESHSGNLHSGYTQGKANVRLEAGFSKAGHVYTVLMFAPPLLIIFENHPGPS